MLTIRSVMRARVGRRCGYSSKLLPVLMAMALVLFSQPVWANPEARLLLNLSLNGSMTEAEVIAEAESMVNQQISSGFASDPDLSVLEVTVLGNRSGDIIPIVMARVSRTDWQANPSVSAWSTYYRSYALFQRHTPRRSQPVVAAAPQRSGPPRQRATAPRQNTSPAFETAYDANRLTRRAVQSNLDGID